ncbi:MAG: hypothetical protein FJ147_01000 [Deltaproteobacteria bacterium]|nr:hypothetical protein [Deltaproteobacteria bacterium]
MDKKAIIAAKLAEWNLSLTDSELDQLVPAYDNLLRWQDVVHGMLRSRSIADGMVIPESEPLLTYSPEKGGSNR